MSSDVDYLNRFLVATLVHVQEVKSVSAFRLASLLLKLLSLSLSLCPFLETEKNPNLPQTSHDVSSHLSGLQYRRESHRLRSILLHQLNGFSIHP